MWGTWFSNLKHEVVLQLLEHAGIVGGNVCIIFFYQFWILISMQGAYWTLNNTSNNTTFLKSLQAHYKTAQPIVKFNAHDSHIPCFSHIVNIVIQCILKALDQGVTQDSELPDLIDADNEDDKDDTAVVADNDDNNNGESSCGIISKVQRLVHTIRASGQQQELLCSVIIRGNESKLWVNTKKEVISIQPYQLILNVCMCWDSTYQMLICTLKFSQVNILYLFLIININNTNSLSSTWKI